RNAFFSASSPWPSVKRRLASSARWRKEDEKSRVASWISCVSCSGVLSIASPNEIYFPFGKRSCLVQRYPLDLPITDELTEGNPMQIRFFFSVVWGNG